MDSKKLAALPSSNQQGTWRVTDAPWERPFTVAKVNGPGSYRLQTL
jgi:hypothetical protein